MLRYAFFGLLLAAMVSIAFQFLGFRTIEITVLLVISALLLLEIIKTEEREELENAMREEIGKKLEGMERILNYIFRKTENLLTAEHLNEIERRVELRLEHSERKLREKFREEMEEISRKIREIETRVAELKAHANSLHKRVESVENYIFEEEEL